MAKSFFGSKRPSNQQFCAIVAAALIIYALYQYSQQKKTNYNAPGTAGPPSNPQGVWAAGGYPAYPGQQPKAANPLGQNGAFAKAGGSSSNNTGVPACSSQATNNPSSLLPSDANTQWAAQNPTGSGKLQNVNLLQAGYNIGINTVGSSLRNANQQVRSEPPNPQGSVGPWNNTTIEPDVMRVPLEIGCGPQ
jgi:hypothetical protein